MKKIEQKMIRALWEHRDWKQDNTQVIVVNDEIRVRLHGNIIFTTGENYSHFSFQGWPGPVTRSRLNAIAEGYFHDEISFKQVQFKQIGIAPAGEFILPVHDCFAYNRSTGTFEILGGFPLFLYRRKTGG